MKQIRIVDDRKDIPFKVIIVESGDSYGLNNCLIHDGEKPMVEFYDNRRLAECEHGQFVSRYNMDTFMDIDNRGLYLYGSEPDWQITANTVKYIQDWIQESNTKLYAIGSNIPGYMPDVDPVESDTLDHAKEILAECLTEYLDEMHGDDRFSEARLAECSETLDKVKQADAQECNVYIGHYVFWIQEG